MQKAFEIETTQAYPLGVTFQTEGMHISAVLKQPEGGGDFGEAGILLYDRHHKDGIRIPFPEQGRIGAVCSMLLRGYRDRTCSYLFYQGERIFQDPCCKQIENPYRYGEVRTNLPRCKVLDGDYAWDGDIPLNLPFEDMILYALHVRGFTRHRSSQVKHKGTYAGITEKIPYLQELGITSLLLMPAYEFDEMLPQENLTQPVSMEQAAASYMRMLPLQEPETAYKVNYWGYQKGLYYVPKSRYAHGRDAVTEYKDMVRELHRNGMEVLMQFYFPPEVSALEILEILKYWVLEYHIDGFHLMGVQLPVDLLMQEPLLARTKLLAQQPYQQGQNVQYAGCRHFGQMNEGFLYDMRRFLKSDGNTINNFLSQFRYNSAGMGVVNYIAKWDGFRLADLVSYDRKHNEQNGEDNQDGTDENCSWNCGAEGRSRKKSILQLRIRQMKNALSLLFLSQGTPLLYSGDEFGNSQEGNNNPYCQDNEIAWIKWKQTETGRELLAYTKQLIRLRKTCPILHHAAPLKGIDFLSCGYPDISFHGKEAWRPDTGPASRSIGVLYCGAYAQTDGAAEDTLFYIGINMHWEDRTLALPQPPRGKVWTLISTTGEPQEACPAQEGNPQEIRVASRTLEIYTLMADPLQETDRNQKKTGAKRRPKPAPQ